MLSGCAKSGTSHKDPDLKWNGYFDFLKDGEVIHTLWAGQHINVGTVTYGIDDSANFYVTYDCSQSGWVMSETHMFAGKKKDMPVNKPGNPKIGHFPYATDHGPGISTYTYRIPLATLPPADNPGFVVASHCVVQGSGNQEETAWAEGDYSFTDKDWGWYDVYFYNQQQNTYTLLYGTEYGTDTLKIYQLDVTNGGSETVLIWEEYVGNNPGTFDASAYDPENHEFYFVNYTSQELYKTDMNDTMPSVSLGFLDGTGASATFYNSKFYYIDEASNNIICVDFDEEGNISGELVLSTLPGIISVNDISMSPAGDFLYILGDVNNGDTELITWDVSTNSYATIDVAVNQGSQIAYGSDGNLYALEPNGGSGTIVYILNLSTGIINPINEDSIIIIDPFTDISGGPFL